MELEYSLCTLRHFMHLAYDQGCSRSDIVEEALQVWERRSAPDTTAMVGEPMERDA
jgi:hypothetical protein